MAESETNYDSLIEEPSQKQEAPLGEAPADYDELVPEKPETQALKQAMAVVADKNPDQHAKVVDLARKTGLPADHVERNFDDVKKENEQDSVDYDAIVNDSPVTARFASDTDNAAVIKDDFLGLQKIEALFKDLTHLDFIGQKATKNVHEYNQIEGLGKGIDSISDVSKRLGSSLVSGTGTALSQVAKLPNIAGAAAYAPYNIALELAGRPRSEQIQYPETNPVAEYYARGAQAYAQPEMNYSISTEIEKGNYKRAGMALATQFLSNAPNQAALLLSAVAGYPAVGLVGAGVTTAASTYQESIQKDASPAAATVNALGAGVAESAFESLGGAIPVLKHWEGVIASRYGKDVSWQVMKDFGKSLVHSFVSEGSEEYATQLAQDFSSYITGVDTNALKGTFRRGLDAGIIGGISGVTMTAPTALAVGVSRNQDIAKANRDRQAFLEASKVIEQSKTFTRDKTTTANFVEKAVENTPFAEINVDAQGAETYFQSRNMSAVTEFQNMGVSPQSFLAAKQTGTLIKIPARVWAEKIVGTEHVAGLADHITFDENGKTVAQAKEQEEALGDAASKVVEEAKTAQVSQERIAANRKEVEAKISANLNSAKPENMDAKTWNQNVAATSKLWAAVVASQAEQTGKSVDEVLAQMPTKIEVGGKTVNLTPFTEKSAVANPNDADNDTFMQTARLTSSGKILGLVDDSVMAKGDKAVQKELEKLIREQGNEAPAEKPPNDSKLDEILGRTNQKSLTNSELKKIEKRVDELSELIDTSKFDSEIDAYSAELHELQSRLEESLKLSKEVERTDNDLVISRIEARFGDTISEKEWSAIDKKSRKANTPYMPIKIGKGEALSFGGSKSTGMVGFYPNFNAEPTGQIGDPKKFINSKKVFESAEMLNWVDHKYGATKALIEKHAEQGTPLTITTSSDLISHDDYVDVLPKGSQIHFVVASLDDEKLRRLTPGLPSVKRILIAMDKLRQEGFTVKLMVPDTKEKTLRDVDQFTMRKLIEEKNAKWTRQDDTVYQTSASSPNMVRVQDEKGFKSNLDESEVLPVLATTEEATPENAKTLDARAREVLKSLQTSNGVEPIVNRDTGWPIDISSKGITKTFRGIDSAERATAIIHFKEILEGAKYVWSGFDRQGRVEGIQKFDYLYAPVRINGKDFIAKISVKETTQKDANRKHYTISAVEMERPEGLSAEGRPKSAQTRAIDEPSQITVADLLAHINLRRQSGDAHYQADKTKVQGATVFTPDFAVIKLLNADQSTLIHESAHVWLDYLFKQGSLEPKLKDWLKVQDDQKKLTTEQHETFARGFERYLFEGHAPNDYVRSAFRKLSQWLISIYKNLTELNRQAGFDVQLSDDARAVFDRLLSAENELEQAEASVSATVGNVDVEELAPAVRKKLESLQEKAHGEAFDELVKAQMAELSKEHKAEIAAVREKREPEVRKQVEEQSIYKAIAGIKEAFGKDAKAVSQKFLDGKLSEDDQVSLEVFAESAGFSSADHLANIVIKTESVDYAVKQILDAETAPSIKDTDELRAMAEEAVHNVKRLELLALEAEILDRLVGKASTDEANKALLRNAAKPEEVLATARERLNALPIKEAGSFRPYYTAERNAAVKVAKALKDKDFLRAAEAKRQQMLAHAMAIESQKIRRQAEKNLRYLEKSRQLDREKLGRQEHFEQFAKLLNRFGFERSDFDGSEPGASLSDWVATVDEDNSSINIAEWIYDESYAIDAKELTPVRLQDLRDAVQNIRHFASAEDKLEAFGAKITATAIEAELIEASQKFVTKRKQPKPIESTGPLPQIAGMGKSYAAALANVRDTLKVLGGDNEDSNPYLKYFWRTFYDAYNHEAALNEKIQPALKKVWSEYSKAEIKELVSKNIFIEEWGVSVPRIYLIAMARNLGNDTSRERLFSTAPVGIHVPWGEQTAMQAFSKYLSAKDWRSVQNAWDAADALWPDAAAHHKDMTGFEPVKIEPAPFTVVSKDGETVEMKGGYFPLVADPRDVSRGGAFSQLREELETPLYQENNPGWKGVTKTGYTKGRAAGARYAVRIQESILTKHMAEVVHDIAFRRAVRDVQKILARPAVKGEIISAVGHGSYSELVTAVKGAASGYAANRPENRFAEVLDSAANFLSVRTTASVLLGKVGPVLQNLSNFALLPGAVRDFGWKDTVSSIIFKGAFDYWGKAGVAWQLAAEKRAQISAKSKFMGERFQSPDYTLAAQRIEKLGGNGLSEDVKEFAGSWLAWTENLIAIPAWEQAYEQELQRNGGDEKEAVYYADNLIINALGSPRKFDTAPAVKVRGIAKAFVMFFSFLSTYGNRWKAELRQSGRSGNIVSPKLLGFIAAQTLLFVPFSQALTGKCPKDTDDDGPMKWFKWLLRSNLDNIFGMFPVIRDVLQYATDKATGEETYGGIRLSPLASTVSSLEKTIGLLGKDYEAEGATQDAAETLTKAVSIATPYPDQFNIWFWNAYDMFENGASFRPEDVLRRRKRAERGQ